MKVSLSLLLLLLAAAAFTTTTVGPAVGAATSGAFDDEPYDSSQDNEYGYDFDDDDDDNVPHEKYLQPTTVTADTEPTCKFKCRTLADPMARKRCLGNCLNKTCKRKCANIPSFEGRRPCLKICLEREMFGGGGDDGNTPDAEMLVDGIDDAEMLVDGIDDGEDKDKNEDEKSPFENMELVDFLGAGT